MFESSRLKFRKITLEDAKDIFSWTSDPRINKFVIYPLNKNIEDTINWIKTIKDEDNEFLIVEKLTNKVVGSCSLKYSEEYNGYLAGINLSYDSCGKGYGTESILALEKYAKEELKINEIFGRVFQFNKVSLSMCDKIGYKVIKKITFYKPPNNEEIPSLLLKKSLK